MMKLWHYIAGFLAAAGAGLAGSSYAAETQECKLEIVRLEPQSSRGMNANEYLYRNVNSQGFYMPLNNEQNLENNEKQFKKVVEKEPEKYVAKRPLRGAVKFGDKSYGFAFDKKDEKSKGFDRLHFDINGNGDLTDDKPIDALDQEKSNGLPEQYIRFFFPRVDLSIEVDETKVDYSFLVEEQGWVDQYIYPNFKAAAYCQGEITLDGEKILLAVLDYNSNGRFDDVISMKNMGRGMNGEFYPQYGDKLLINPGKEIITPISRSSAGEREPYLSKINALNGKYYEVKVSAVGDELTCTPSTAALGKIACAHSPCTVELISELGYLSLALKESETMEVPEGDWRLLSYTWTIENWKEPPKKEEPKKEGVTPKKSGKKPSLLGAFKKALIPSVAETKKVSNEPRYGPEHQSMLSARGTNKTKPLAVEAGKTSTLKFGTPYKPIVKVQYHNAGTANLSLVIVGAAGETVSNLYVNGRRLGKPKLTITNQKDEVVQQGDFEYG